MNGIIFQDVLNQFLQSEIVLPVKQCSRFQKYIVFLSLIWSYSYDFLPMVGIAFGSRSPILQELF